MERSQSGYYLIESLVALLIFAGGTLGLVNLYGVLQTRSWDAEFRVLASGYANEILSVIIADNVNSGCYTLPTPGTCSSAVATTYITGWLAEVNAGLPIPAGTPPVIAISATNQITVTINWQRDQDKFVHNYTLIGQY